MSPSRKNHENVSGPGNQSPRTKVADQTPFLSSSKSSDAATPTCRSILRKRIRVNRHAVGNDYIPDGHRDEHGRRRESQSPHRFLVRPACPIRKCNPTPHTSRSPA
ncbi:hypothetical protein E4U14_000035 [Claviceps sp. LM454 group G7]|nr:hypothetical protein E4U14_000035 [Claviceps sp. LM454 group G7]